MTRKLKSLATLVMDQRSAGELPYVALEHVVSGGGGLDPNTDLPLRDTVDAGVSLVQPGDVLFGKLRPYLAKTWFVDRPAYASTELLALRANADVEPRWLAYLVRSQSAVQWATASSDGTKMPRTSWEKFAQYLVPEPPTVKHQQAIADYLDVETARIDALITKKQKSIELLDLRTESLLASLLEPLIREWGEVPLKAIAHLEVSNIDKKSYEGQQAVFLCNYTDVYYHRSITRELDFMAATADTGQIKRLTLRRNDVLITKDSETADDIAVPAWVAEDLPDVVLGYHLALLRPKNYNGRFLYWAVVSRRCRDAFSLSASGVTRVGLRRDQMSRVPVPAVPLHLQKAVVSQMDNSVRSQDQVVKALRKQIELLRERRQALITAAVTGELEIPEVAA